MPPNKSRKISADDSPSVVSTAKKGCGNPPSYYWSIIETYLNENKQMPSNNNRQVIRRRIDRRLKAFEQRYNTGRWDPLTDITEDMLPGLLEIGAITNDMFDDALAMFNHPDYYLGEKPTSEEMIMDGNTHDNSTVSNDNEEGGRKETSVNEGDTGDNTTSIGIQNYVAKDLKFVVLVSLKSYLESCGITPMPSGGLKENCGLFDLLFNPNYGLLSNPRIMCACHHYNPETTVQVMAARVLSLLNDDTSNNEEVLCSDELYNVDENRLDCVCVLIDLERQLAEENPDHSKGMELASETKFQEIENKSPELKELLERAQNHADNGVLPAEICKYLRLHVDPKFSFRTTCMICGDERDSFLLCECSSICQACNFITPPSDLNQALNCKGCRQHLYGNTTKPGLADLAEIARKLQDQLTSMQEHFNCNEGKVLEDLCAEPLRVPKALNDRTQSLLMDQLRIVSSGTKAVHFEADARRLVRKFVEIAKTLPQTSELLQLKNTVLESMLEFEEGFSGVTSSPHDETTVLAKAVDVVKEGLRTCLQDFEDRHNYHPGHGVWMPRVSEYHVNRINSHFPLQGDTRYEEVYAGTERRLLRRWFPYGEMPNPPDNQSAGDAGNNGNDDQQNS